MVVKRGKIGYITEKRDGDFEAALEILVDRHAPRDCQWIRRGTPMPWPQPAMSGTETINERPIMSDESEAEDF